MAAECVGGERGSLIFRLSMHSFRTTRNDDLGMQPWFGYDLRPVGSNFRLVRRPQDTCIYRARFEVAVTLAC